MKAPSLPRKIIHHALVCALAAMATSASAANVTWIDGIDGTGNWEVLTNWSGGALPVAADNVFIDSNAGINSVVSLNSDRSIGTLTVDAGDSLNFANGAVLSIFGTSVVNQGVINLNSTGSYTGLLIRNAHTTLSGSGVLNLGAQANNIVYGSPAGVLLTNADGHTIQGSGQLGYGGVGDLDNQGLIVATNSTAPLSLRLPNSSNSGIIRAAGGQLTFGLTTLNNASGLIEAVGSNVLMSESTIEGGTLHSSNGGVINLQSNPVLKDLANTGQVVVLNGGTGILQGAIDNSGDIKVNSTGTITQLRIDGNVTLNGTGAVTLSDNGNNRIWGLSGTGTEVLTNATGHTIQGAGQLGVNLMGLNNQGLILADQPNALTLDLSGVGGTNTGTLRAGGGQLTLQGSSLNNAGGLIDAAGSNVVINSSTVTGGTLQGSGGKIFMEASSNLVNVSNTGQAEIANLQDGLLTGTFSNSGNLQVASTGNQTDLRINGNVTLAGTGAVTLSNNGNNRVLGHSGTGTEVLTNATGHTIQGAGQLGVNFMGLNNQGLVAANGSNGLVIDASTAGISNSGTLQAGTGVLTIQNSIVTNTASGVLDAAGSNIVITGGSVTGGTLQSTGGKVFLQGSGNLVDVSNTGQAEIANLQDGLLSGTFTNSGNLQVASTGNQTDLRIDGDVTLAGTGTVTLSNNGNNRVLGHSGTGSEVLTNAIGQTIQGAGQLGANFMGLNNQGLILANQTNALTLDVSGVGGTNTGTLRAGGGQLTLQGSSLNNAGGLIDAAGSNVVITGGSSITGGTLQSSGDGKVFLQGLSNLANVSNTGQVEIANAQDGQLTGTFSNSGNLQVASIGSQTELRINGDVTLAGTGTLTLSGNGNNRVWGLSGTATEVLTNATGHTIQGAGQLGVNLMGLNNQGLILADQPNALTLDLSGVGGTNTGTLRAGGGQLTLQGSSLNNAGGLIDAAGGNVVITGGSTVTGGTLQSSGDGKVFLQGSSNLANVSNTGQVEIANAQDGQLTGTFSNSGNLQVTSTGSQTELRINGDVTLAGTGTLTLSNNGNNRVWGLSGTATEVLTNAAGHTIQGAGQLGVNLMGLNNQGLILANQSLALNINTSATGMANSGTLQADLGSTLNIADRFSNSGTVFANGGTVNANDGFTHGSGTVLIEGNGIVSIGADSSTTTLTHNGSNPAGLSLGTNDLTVHGDYTNANWGVGDSFNHRVNVSGTGQILAAGDVAQAVTGIGVSNGGTGTPTLTLNTGNVHVGEVKTFAYQIANTGNTGPDLRGALQTGVNGGHITDSRLSGSGVTASNWGPVAASSNSGNLEVAFTVDTAGLLAPLTGQKVNFANNFDNVSGQLLSIELGTGAAAYNLASGNAAPSPVTLDNQRVGGTNSANLTVSNTGPAGGFTEVLNASFGANTGSATNNGGAIAGGLGAGGVAAGDANSTAMKVGVNTGSAGAKSGTVTLDYVSNGTGTSGLANTDRGSQEITVSGNVYQVAQANLPNSVDLGKFHVGAGQPTSLSQAITIGNTLAAPVGYQEGLDVQANGTTGQATISGGPITNLAANSTSNAIAVGLTGLTAGVNTGTATFALGSNGSGTSGLATLGQGNANIGVTGTGYNFAQSNVIDPVHIVAHVGEGGGSVSQALVISNLAPTGGFSEGLDSSFGSYAAGGGDTLTPIFSGSITNLAAGATDSTSMLATISTLTAGLFNGSVVVEQASNGATTSGLGITPLDSQNVGVSGSVTGGVFTYAQPTINNAPIDFGNVRINTGVADQSISISNTAPPAPTTELLNGSFVSAPSGFTGSGSFMGLAPGAAPDTSILVGFDTSAGGAKSGNVAVNFISDGTSILGDGTTTNLGNTNVAVQGNVYRLANPILNTTDVFLAARVGDAPPSEGVSVTNSSPDAYTEGLKADIGMASPGFYAGGNIANLAAGDSNADILQVMLDTGTAGSFAGTALVNFASTGAGTTGEADVMVGAGAVNLTGRVYTPAVAQVNTPSIDFGIVHKGDLVGPQSISVTNAAAVTALNDVLVGGITGTTGVPFSGSGNLGTGLAAGDIGSLQVELNTSAAGVFSGAATTSFASHNADMADASLGSTDVNLLAQINNYANPEFAFVSGLGTVSGGGLSFTLDFGNVYQGSGMVTAQLSVLNDVAGPADWLDGIFDVTTFVDKFVLSGFNAFSGVEAGQSQGGGLFVQLDTAFLGFFSDTVLLTATGRNASGYFGDFNIALYLEGNVIPGNVPEPGTLGLLAIGGLAGAWRRRSK